MIHTYFQETADGNLIDCWVVGVWVPAGDARGCIFERLRSFGHEGEAAAYVSYLNGGEPPVRLLMRLGMRTE
jgi:hypothetical protein